MPLSPSSIIILSLIPYFSLSALGIVNWPFFVTLLAFKSVISITVLIYLTLIWAWYIFKSVGLIILVGIK